ncbi:MAG: peptide chain release factor N(5)-glutamine methyltransferase [Sphingobacteriia bacterium]|nr:MAG: peptide chain release factor N(5)-glutamine methyltransferase [Sphingobacteriia bacterium]
MTISEAKQSIINSILLHYDKREAANIASMLMEWITKMNKTDMLLNKSVLLHPDQINNVNDFSKRLILGEPMQYIIGEAWFMSNRFKVSKGTLIPRPETEELVAWVLEDIQQLNLSDIHLIDIGTGSGCIPISIKAKAPSVNIVAIDISNNAIAIAEENAAQLDCSIQFKMLDFLDETTWANIEPAHIIVSNPPYIKELEKSSMHQNVVDFEPHQALFVPNDDALIFYRAIVRFSQTHLLPGGTIYLEINDALGKEVVALFSSSYASVELRKDIFEKDRMVKIKKPN